MKNNIDLSVIIVSYNTAQLLEDCLNSLIPINSELNIEIVVVDNGSKDESVDRVKNFQNIFDLKLIKNKKNVGFGAANNQGMRESKGDKFLLLNSDTIANKEAILSCIKLLGNKEKTGVISCKLIGIDKQVQSNGGYFPNLFNVFCWMSLLDDLGFIYKSINPYHINPNFEKGNTREQDWVTGAFFLLKEEVFESVGGFDEDFFMYAEEMEYCYRIKKKGWEIVYNQSQEIIHIGGASGTTENALINELKGIQMFFKKHKGNTFLLELLLKLGSLLRIIVFLILGKQKRAKIYVNAFRNL